MPYNEFLGWMSYFKKRPLGWREDLRTFYTMQASAMSPIKKKPYEIFPSLEPIFKENENRNPIDTLKGSYLFHKMLGAIGGDKLELDV
jgi:hypothetical protein